MKISIIGAAGCIGSSIAMNLATRGLAEELVVADIRRDWLEHHCIDFFDAAVASRVDIGVHIGGHEDIAGSDIVILAAGPNVLESSRIAAEVPRDPAFEKLPNRQRMLPANLGIIREWMGAVNRYCPQAIVITATNPAEILNHASYLFSTSRERRRFIGYSFNDTVRFKIAAAQVKGIAPSQIEAVVVGEHGGSMVCLFSTVTRNGEKVTFTDEEKARVLAITNDYLPHMIRLGLPRSSGWLTGVGIANLVQAIVRDTREAMPCCAVLDGEYGYSGVSIGVPVVLGLEGIIDIVKLDLTPEEEDLLDKSVKNLSVSRDYLLRNISA